MSDESIAPVRKCVIRLRAPGGDTRTITRFEERRRLASGKYELRSWPMVPHFAAYPRQLSPDASHG